MTTRPIIPRAAIYARRSTEEHQAASIATQVESATLFCAARGWQLAATYTDDGVSGSEFERRPGLNTLLGATKDFDVLVVRDLDRIGRDQTQVPLFLERLHAKGVEVWCYSSGERVRIDDPTSLFLTTAVAFARQLEVRALRARITERLRRGAEKGYCVGGDVYGYRRERTPEGVAYHVDPTEAAVVRRIFEARARGVGLRTIAQELNGDGVPSPRAGRRGTGSWASTTVRDLLHSERYRGVLSWGRKGTTYQLGTRKSLTRGDEEVVRVERAELAIVDEDLWRRTRAQDRTSTGAPRRRPPRYPLSGLARCAECGGPMQVSRRTTGTGATARSQPVYLCAWARDRGRSVCTNTVRRPTEELDGTLLGWIRRAVLTGPVVDEILSMARARIDALATVPDQRREGMVKELARVEAEAERIADAITRADAAPETLVRRLTEREARAKELRATLDALPVAQGVALRWSEVEAEARRRVEALREMVDGGAEDVRRALEILLAELKIYPVGEEGRRRLRLRGAVRLRHLGVNMGASLEGVARSDSTSEAGDGPVFPFDLAAA